MNLSRRDFVKSATLAAAGIATASAPFTAKAAVRKRGIKLGLDNFSVRAMGWKAPRLIEYAAELKTDSLFITDLVAFEKFSDDYCADLRKKATDADLQIHLGSWSICPTSKSFKKDWGTAEEHLALGIRMAKALGSPVFRVVLGAQDDRKTEGGIEARIADTVKVLQSQKSKAVDAGVKIAVENHAGDMQAWEVVSLVEAAGKDYVGVNADSGNALWTMEDPLRSLEILAPYVITTSLRDSAVWESENGATVQWTAMGEGTIDTVAYFDKFEKLCPGVPVHIETISGFNRELAYLKPDFMALFPKAKASDLARFIAVAKKGKSRPTHRSANNTEEQEYQRGEIERSIKNAKELLGLGLKA